MDIESQKILFERIHDKYVTHYFSIGALYWKRKLVWDHFRKNGISIENANVAELFSGSGYNSIELLSLGNPKLLIGFDISNPAIDDYKKLTGRDGFVADLTNEIPIKEKFDYIFIFGGLHHVYYSLDKVLRNIDQLLAPNGKLVVFEPTYGTIWDKLRDFWYRKDAFFDEKNEHSLTIQDVEKSGFKSISHHYITGPGYLLVYNSMILRVPVKIANLLSWPLTMLDRILSSFNLSYFSFCFTAVFVKKE